MQDQITDSEIDALLRQAAAQWGAQKPSKSSDQVCFDTGTSFHAAALKCASPETMQNGQIFAPTSPVICCFAFACELYLKSLLISANRPSRGHKLQLLLNALTKNDFDGVCAEYEQITGRKRLAFKKDIAEVSDAFVEWRYIFEVGSTQISVARLSNIARAIYSHIRTSRCTWDVAEHLDGKVRSPLSEDVARVVSLGGGRMIRAVRR